MNQSQKETLKSYLEAVRDGAAAGLALGVVILPFALLCQVAVNAITKPQ